MVHHLKDKIKRESPELDDLATKMLDLYRIDVDTSNEQHAIKEVETLAQTLRRTDRLTPTWRLNRVFPSGAPADRILILVKLPEGESMDSRARGVVPMSPLSDVSPPLTLRITRIVNAASLYPPTTLP